VQKAGKIAGMVVRGLFIFFACAYVARVPILCGAALVLLRHAAFSGQNFAADLLNGLFDIDPLPGGVIVAVCAVFFVASAVIATDIIVRYAHARFDVAELHIWWRANANSSIRISTLDVNHQALTRRSAFAAILYTGISLYLLSGLPRHTWLFTALAYVFSYPALWWLFRSPKGLLFRSHRRLQHAIGVVTAFTPLGYSEDRAQAEDSQAKSMPVYHAGALLGLLTAWIFYLVAYALSHRFPLPALASMILWLTLLCWALSAVTFLLDRVRFPLLLFLALLFWLLPNYPYTFPTLAASGVALPSPDEVLEKTPKFIVVAASGGGLHASGWTTRVLGEIYLRLPTPELKKRFAQRIRVISPVSGGSVGTLYFLNASLQQGFRDGTMERTNLDRFLFEPAIRSSLEEIAQALIFEDFWRPVHKGAMRDRGRVAEETWESAATISSDKNDNPLAKPLAWWADQAKNGIVPAVLFNTTVADTGERAVASTVGFPTLASGGRRFRDITPGFDVPLVTAARLSATFPIVTPAARPAGYGNNAFNFVDGGYYDNYGMSTLVEWLDDALKDHLERNVLVLQIRDSPKPESSRSKDESGYLFQLKVPLVTLARFREAGQIAHGDLELSLLSAKTGNTIQHVTFNWPHGRTPLSWHLTQEQKDTIEKAVDDDGVLGSMVDVCRFLADGQEELEKTCTGLR
jgi:hypothetical protein